MESNNKIEGISLVSSRVVLTCDSSIFPESMSIKLPSDYVKSLHHTLPGHVYGCTNVNYQNIRRGTHSHFILADLRKKDTLVYSVIVTVSSPHCSISLTLYLNVQLITPVVTLLTRAILLSLTRILFFLYFIYTQKHC